MWDLFLPKHTNVYLKVENMPAIGFEIKRKCKVCGEVFLAKTLDSQYCSPKCSKVAWKRKKDAKEKNEKLDRLAQHIPDIREYVSVKEAVAMFGVEQKIMKKISSQQISAACAQTFKRCRKELRKNCNVITLKHQCHYKRLMMTN